MHHNSMSLYVQQDATIHGLQIK